MEAEQDRREGSDSEAEVREITKKYVAVTIEESDEPNQGFTSDFEGMADVRKVKKVVDKLMKMMETITVGPAKEYSKEGGWKEITPAYTIKRVPDYKEKVARQILIHWIFTYYDTVDYDLPFAWIRGAWEMIYWLVSESPVSYLTVSDHDWNEVEAEVKRLKKEAK